MSRIGKNPVVLPAGVEVSVGEQIVVKGPLGTLKTAAHPAVTVAVEGQSVVVSKVAGAVNAGAMWGTMRANLNSRSPTRARACVTRARSSGARLERQVRSERVRYQVGLWQSTSRWAQASSPAGPQKGCWYGPASPPGGYSLSAAHGGPGHRRQRRTNSCIGLHDGGRSANGHRGQDRKGAQGGQPCCAAGQGRRDRGRGVRPGWQQVPWTGGCAG